MSPSYADIARLLDQAKRRRGRVILLAAGAGAAAAVLLFLLLGASALALGARPVVARALGLGAGALALAAAAAWAVRAFRQGAWTPEGAARTVAAGSPALRSDLVSAVELARDREALAASGAVSVALVDAHVARTAEAIREVDLRSAIPDRPARRAGLALAAVAGLHAVAFLVGGASLGRAWARVVAGEPVAEAGPSLDPITGDVELTYRFPAHTRRDPQTLSGTGGEIRAPRGTEVTLRTRADRTVEAAEVELSLTADARPAAGDGPGDPAGATGPSGPPGAPAPSGPGAGAPAPVRPPGPQRVALAVAGGRDLSGTLVVADGGTYRFRFRSASGRVVAEGPPIPVVVEPDAFPTVRLTAPLAEVEVTPDAVVRVDWQAEDDFGLDGLELVTRGPGGAEKRRPVRTLPGVRRDSGSFELPVAAERLGEGERLTYWLEVKDNDAVSGPKKGASATQVVKLYSAAEHRRLAMEKARQAWEEMITLLADRLETFAAGAPVTPDRLTPVLALDVRTRALHERLRAAAAEIRKEKAAPREVAQALQNIAASVKTAEQRATALHQLLQRLLGAKLAVDRGTAAQAEATDRLLDEALEKGILYLEALFDKARAEDLVRMARDLADRRRELQQLLEKYRDAPSEKTKQDVLAQIRRMRERMQELMARMAETAKGFHDEHMNAEALAELGKQKDMMSGLDEAEKALERGDVEAAMKALDQLGGQMDQLMAGMKKTGELPDEKQRELMEEMLAFKEQLEQVQAEQEQVAAETEQVKAELRKRMAEKLEQLAREARAELQKAQPGATPRAETDLEAAQEAVADLQRALAMKDLDASQEMAQRALAPATRLAMTMEEEALMAERFPGATGKEAPVVREAQKHARDAAQKLAQLGAELGKLMPDPRQGMTPGEQGKLSELAGKQGQLERQAGELQGKLGSLMQKAPIFPPSAPQLLGETRGHMGQAAGELSQRNAQRGHGEQQAALDSLGRFKQGLEQMAKKGGGQPGGGFPFPFGEQGQGGRDGDMGDPAPEKVEIPGAEAHRVPEEFRKDLLEAMKQGAPEKYKGEVQRYYEELVK